MKTVRQKRINLFFFIALISFVFFVIMASGISQEPATAFGPCGDWFAWDPEVLFYSNSDPGELRCIEYRIHTNIIALGSAWVDAIEEAADTWNNVCTNGGLVRGPNTSEATDYGAISFGDPGVLDAVAVTFYKTFCYGEGREQKLPLLLDSPCQNLDPYTDFKWESELGNYIMQILGTRMVLSSYEDWSADSGGPPSGYHDVQSVVTHEFGHWLLLGHPEGTTQETELETMYCGPAPGSIYKRDLFCGDKQGLKILWGTRLCPWGAHTCDS